MITVTYSRQKMSLHFWHKHTMSLTSTHIKQEMFDKGLSRFHFIVVIFITYLMHSFKNLTISSTMNEVGLCSIIVLEVGSMGRGGQTRLNSWSWSTHGQLDLTWLNSTQLMVHSTQLNSTQLMIDSTQPNSWSTHDQLNSWSNQLNPTQLDSTRLSSYSTHDQLNSTRLNPTHDQLNATQLMISSTQLNSTQLNSWPTQLNSTQLNSTQLNSTQHRTPKSYK